MRSALAIVNAKLLMAGCAQAAEWHVIGEGTEGRVHVDMAARGSPGSTGEQTLKYACRPGTTGLAVASW